MAGRRSVEVGSGRVIAQALLAGIWPAQLHAKVEADVHFHSDAERFLDEVSDGYHQGTHHLVGRYRTIPSFSTDIQVAGPGWNVRNSWTTYPSDFRSDARSHSTPSGINATNGQRSVETLNSRRQFKQILEMRWRKTWERGLPQCSWHIWRMHGPNNLRGV